MNDHQQSQSERIDSGLGAQSRAEGERPREPVEVRVERVERPRAHYEVFERLIRKLTVVGLQKEIDDAKAAFEGDQRQHEILGTFTTREKFNPIAAQLTVNDWGKDCRVLTIATEFTGFVYVRCDWDDAKRQAFIAKWLAEAAHVQAASRSVSGGGAAFEFNPDAI